MEDKENHISNAQFFLFAFVWHERVIDFYDGDFISLRFRQLQIHTQNEYLYAFLCFGWKPLRFSINLLSSLVSYCVYTRTVYINVINRNRHKEEFLFVYRMKVAERHYFILCRFHLLFPTIIMAQRHTHTHQFTV